MEYISNITLLEWIIMIAVFTVIGAAYWLIDDSRKRGMQIGGKACGGCPYCCQFNSDGTQKEVPVREEVPVQEEVTVQEEVPVQEEVTVQEAAPIREAVPVQE